jgi:queuosine precursor transporter
MALASVTMVCIAWRVDKERLYSAILIFLILISVTGGKIVEFFGHETNTGNVFYGSVFLATYFLIERYGKREGIRSIWVGIGGVLFFSILLQLALFLTSASSTSEFSNALSLAFSPVSRLALASILGYLVSQTVNVFLYVRLKERFAHAHLWLRVNICNAVAQVFDSAIFFTVAFWGVVAPANMTDIIVTGFAIKVLFMMVAAPLLYFNRIEESDDGKGYASLTLR